GRRRADAVLLDDPAPAVEGQHGRAVRHPLRLRLERLPVAPDDHEHAGDADGRDRHRDAGAAHVAAAGVERGHGRRHDGAAAAGGGDRRDAALVREGPDRDREMTTRLAAHRGGAALWPENSLRAFRESLALGADLVELDVHLTTDGALAVIHDATLRRTTDRRGRVRTRTAAELRRARLRGPDGRLTAEHVPMLGAAI